MQKRQIPPYGLRLPYDLKEQIKQAATQEGRSMNSQIVQHLRAIYQTDDQPEN